MCTFKHCIVVLATVFACAGCGNETLSYLEIPVYANAASSRVFSVGAWSVTLSKAHMALGPVYGCASMSASEDLCSAAQIELTEALDIDLLQAQRVRVAQARGTEGVVQSLRYDLGWSWLGTDTSPRHVGGFLNNHSVVLEGTASNGVRNVLFKANIDIKPSAPDTSSVYSPSFASVSLQSDTALFVDVNMASWIQSIRFDDLASSTTHIAIEPATPSYNGLVLAISNGRSIRFTWGKNP